MDFNLGVVNSWILKIQNKYNYSYNILCNN